MAVNRIAGDATKPPTVNPNIALLKQEARPSFSPINQKQFLTQILPNKDLFSVTTHLEQKLYCSI